MRNLAVLTFVTLDGVMQAPRDASEDTTNGFSHSGWAVPDWEPVMKQVQAEALSEPYEPLFGRRTYDIFAGARAGNRDDPMTDTTKHVVTSHPETLRWKNTNALTGDPVTAISQLKSQDGPPLQVHGSWQLIQTLLANQLIDELRLWTFPVIVGEGKRLFAQAQPSSNLQLIKTAPAGDSGAVMSIFGIERQSPDASETAPTG